MRRFTLIEILVVVAIIGILVSLLAPSLGSARDKSRAAACKSNLKQMGYANTLYADDNEGFFVFEYNNTWWPYLLYGGDYLSPIEESVTCPSQPFEGDWRYGKNFYRHQYIYGAAFNTTNNLRNGSMYGGSKADGTRYRLVKINDVDSASTFFQYADSGRYDSDGQFNQYFSLPWADTSERGVHIRHDNKGNMWFLDGHVETCATGRLKELGHKAVTLEDKTSVPLN